MLHEDFAVIPQLKHQCGSLEKKQKTQRNSLPDPNLDCCGGTSHKPQRTLIQNLSPRSSPNGSLELPLLKQAPTEPPGLKRVKGKAGGLSPASPADEVQMVPDHVAKHDNVRPPSSTSNQRGFSREDKLRNACFGDVLHEQQLLRTNQTLVLKSTSPEKTEQQKYVFS